MAGVRRKSRAGSSGHWLFRALLWAVVFLGWSTWMFALGVMAGKDMTPEYLRLDRLLAGIFHSAAPSKPEARVAKEENPDLFDPHLEFFEDLGEPRSDTETKKGIRIRYTVQVASLKTIDRAKLFVSRLKRRGVAGEIYPVVSGNRTWYAIRSGDFKSFEEARVFARELSRRCNYRPLVVQLPDDSRGRTPGR